MIRGIHIGLNYSGSPYELSGCANDARAMKNLVRASLASYNVVQFKEFTGVFGVQMFLDQIELVSKTMKRSDTLYITFSGHGTQIGLGSEGICLWNGTEIEILQDTHLKYIVSQIKCNVVVVLDSCFSGGMSRDAKNRKRRFVPFDSERMNVFISMTPKSATPASNKSYFLLACQADEVAYESDGMGDFTRALQNAVKGEIPKSSTIKNLITKTRSLLHDQTPLYDCSGGSAAKRVF